MKKYIAIIVMLALHTAVWSQEVSYPCQKLMEKGQYTKAAVALKEAYRGDTADGMTLYALSQLYRSEGYQGYNIERAYSLLKRAQTAYPTLSTHGKSMMIRHGVNPARMQRELHELSILALDEAIRQNTIDAYRHFLLFYNDDLDDLQFQRAQNGINALGFFIAKQQNSEESFDRFMRDHPDAIEYNEAKFLRCQAAYRHAERENTIEAYTRVLALYPDGPDAPETRSRLASLRYQQALASGGERELRQFARDFPDSPLAATAKDKADAMRFAQKPTELDGIDGDWTAYKAFIEQHSADTHLCNLAEQAILNNAVNSGNIDALNYGVGNFRQKNLRDSALICLHTIYANCDQLGLFSTYYAPVMPTAMAQKDYAVLEALNGLNVRNLNSVVATVSATAPYRISYDLLLYLLKRDISQHDWQNCLRTIDKFRDDFASNDDYKALRRVLQTPESHPRTEELATSPLDTLAEGYHACLSPDGRELFYADLADDRHSIKRRTLAPDGKWSEPETLDALSNPAKSIQPLALSPDGMSLVLLADGQLLVSSRATGSWTAPERFPLDVSHVVDLCFAPDGQTLVVAARLKVQDEVKASYNLFVCRKQGDLWGAPLSLGSAINTPGTELAPLLHPDGKTLYFASNRHSNIGGTDIFKTTRLAPDSWTQWSTPLNVGKELNTCNDDYCRHIACDGSSLLRTSQDNDHRTLKTATLATEAKPEAVATLKGTVRDPQGRALQASITCLDPATGKVAAVASSSPADGSYLLAVPLGRSYRLLLSAQGCFPASAALDLSHLISATSVENDFVMTTLATLASDGGTVAMYTIDFAGDGLAPDCRQAVSDLAELLKRHTNSVVLACHCDASEAADGDQARVLTQNRAKALKDALVGEGCNPLKIATAGYGTSMQLVPSSNPQSRQKNQRIEITFKKQ
jgi:hypothetical protein